MDFLPQVQSAYGWNVPQASAELTIPYANFLPVPGTEGAVQQFIDPATGGVRFATRAGNSRFGAGGGAINVNPALASMSNVRLNIPGAPAPEMGSPVWGVYNNPGALWNIYDTNPLTGWSPGTGSASNFANVFEDLAPLAMFAAAPLAGWALGPAGAAGGAAGAEAGAGAAAGAGLGTDIAADVALFGPEAGLVTYGAGVAPLTAAEIADLSAMLGTGAGAGGSVAGDISLEAGGAEGMGLESMYPAAMAAPGGGGLSMGDLLSILATNGGAGVGAAGPVLGPVGTALSLGSSAAGLAGALGLLSMGKKAKNQPPFDPLGYGPRSQWLTQLQQLTANPGMITSMPGYEAGMQAVTRNMAAQGYLGSGNMMAAMAKYGGDFYSQEVQRLAGLAGAQFAPQPQQDYSAAINAYMGGMGLTSSALAALGRLAARKGW